MTTPEIVDQIHELILEEHQISAKSIAEQLGISHKQVGSIIYGDLDMRKLFTKCVPKCLNADPKHQRCQSSEQILEFFRRDTNDFLSRLVIMDETWLYHYNPETKQQSMEWRHSGSPHPQKFRMQESAGNVLTLSCSCTMPRLTGHLQTQKKMAYLGFQCLDHPPYSPDLASSDYHLFPGLKKKI